MKKRKNYHPITVDGDSLLYCVSQKTNQAFFYDHNDIRHVVPLDLTLGPNLIACEKAFVEAWRGKNGAGCWSKKTVSALWKDYCLNPATKPS